MAKKILAFILAALMLFSMVSCGNNEEETGSGDTSEYVDTAELDDGLPNKNMEGFELSIVQNKTYASAQPLDSADLVGSVIEDEIYARNREIEQRFNCKIKVETRDYVLVDDMIKLAAAGDAPYDLIYIISWGAAKINDVVIDLNEVPYINLDEDWWTPSAKTIGSVAGKQFAATSSFSLSAPSASRGFLFNKTMYERLEPGKSMYDYLDTNEWTFENFYRLAKNANTLSTDSKEIYGVGNSAVKFTYMSLIIGAGIQFVEKTEDDMLDFTLDEKLPQYADKLMDFARLGDGEAYKNDNPIDMETNRSEGNAIEGTALFEATTIKRLASIDLRQSTYDFGFMPCPKYSSEQTEYYSPVGHCELMVIMNTVPTDRYENIGILLEALSFNSYHGVMRTYLEEAVTFRYSPDADCMDVMNLILDTRTFEAGEILLVNEYNDLMKAFYLTGGGGNIASGVAAQTTKINTKIESYNNSF